MVLANLSPYYCTLLRFSNRSSLQEQRRLLRRAIFLDTLACRWVISPLHGLQVLAMNISAILNHDSESRTSKTACSSRAGSFELLRHGDAPRALSGDSYFCFSQRVSQTDVTSRTKNFTSMRHSLSSAVNGGVNVSLTRSAAASAVPYKSSERPISVSRSSSLPFRDPFNTPFSIPIPSLYQETLLHPLGHPRKMATCTMESRDPNVQREKSHFCTL